MLDQGIIDKMMFCMCLGKNGGYLQLGGYDKQGFMEDDVTWVNMIRGSEDFKIAVHGIRMNDHFIDGSDRWKVGFVDSGTTFVYVPRSLFNLLRQHFS